ncbi:MAG: zincin-like metallopeptidase domain-containing protein [Dysgonomonas sp.]
MTSIHEYEKLSELEQNEYRIIPSMRCFDVFNLDQTNYPEIFPQEWEELLKKHEEKVELNTFRMYSHSELDNMLEGQNWVCPIQLKISNMAYYAPDEDRIVLPLKTQFSLGEEFYATLLHEMVHSTGSKNRLNRIKSREEDYDAAYAKEELVAELSSALLAYYMGIESTLRDDHASYLKHWVEQMKKEPTYLMSVLSDVVKATKYLSEHIGFDLIEMVPKSESKEQTVINEELVIID